MPRKIELTPLEARSILLWGIERENIFLSDSYRKDFLDRFGDLVDGTQTDCFAWALMPNHDQLLLRIGLPPISRIMAGLFTNHKADLNMPVVFRHKGYPQYPTHYPVTHLFI